MSIYLKCAINSKWTRNFLNTLMMLIFWYMKKTSTKIVEISKKCTSSANDERFDMNLCLFRLSMNWFISLKIRESSRSTWTQFNRNSTFEFSTCRSTHDWNKIHTYEKFKKKWRNKSWFSRNCLSSYEKRLFAKFECCTFCCSFHSHLRHLCLTHAQE
jgi:hypothetical protein